MENIWTSLLKIYSWKKLGPQSILELQMCLKKTTNKPTKCQDV